MEITEFKESHIEEAADISFRAWGEEFSGAGFEEDFVRFVYRSMVEYYDRDRNYSFAAVNDGRLKGFLLGYPAGTGPGQALSRRKLTPEEKTVLENYIGYLENNGAACERHANENSGVIGLIASEEKGAGRLLAERFEKKCAAGGKSCVVLWADATCGYGFYEKTGYETAEIFDQIDSDGRAFKTRIFKKRIIG